MNQDERPDTRSRGEETDDVLSRLVREARSGNEHSFDRLVEHVRSRVYRWALAGTGDPDEAEDVAQEALLRLHRHLASFEGRSRFDTWLYRITANVASTARDRAARRSRGVDGIGAAFTGSWTGSDRRAPGPVAADASQLTLERRLDVRRVARLVHVYFERLPPRQREVFDLVDLQGYTPREVAEMMEMNPTTVRAHLFKARRTIRDHILRQHPEQVEDYA